MEVLSQVFTAKRSEPQAATGNGKSGDTQAMEEAKDDLQKSDAAERQVEVWDGIEEAA